MKLKSFVFPFALLALTAPCVFSQTTGTWNVDAGGNWSTVGNWTGLTGGVVPNAINAAVTFGPVITTGRSVTLDTNVTLGSLTFNEDTVGANAYAVGFNNVARTMTFDVTTGNASILARGSGGYQIGTQGSGQIILNDNLAISAGSAQSAGSNPGGTVVLSSQVTGNGGLILSSLSSNDGTGTATSNGRGTFLRSTVANTFSGGVTVNSGFVAIGSNIGNLGSGTLTLNSNAGGSSTKLRFQTGGGTLANNIVFGNGGGNGGFGIDVEDAFTYTLGTLSGTTASNTLQFNSNAQGTLKLSGNSAGLTTGAFQVRRGTLILDNANAWGTANTAASGWQVGNFSNNSAGSAELLTNGFNVGGNITFNLAGNAGNTNNDNVVIGGTHTTGSASFTGNVTIGRIVGGTRQLQLTSATGGTTVFSGLISDAASGTAATVLPVFKVGGGTVSLTNANTYTGATNVAAGKLLVNNTTGSGTGTGTVSVSSGATLGGSGTISGAVNVTGVLAPGASIESLGSGTLSFNSGSSFQYEINTSTTGADLQFVTGNLNLVDGIDGSVTLSLFDLGSMAALAVDTKFTLISYTGVWDGDIFNGYADDSDFTFAGNQWRINYNDTTGGANFSSDQTGAAGFVTMTVIPEPNAAMLVGGLGMLALLRRRRNA